MNINRSSQNYENLISSIKEQEKNLINLDTILNMSSVIESKLADLNNINTTIKPQNMVNAGENDDLPPKWFTNAIQNVSFLFIS